MVSKSINIIILTICQIFFHNEFWFGLTQRIVVISRRIWICIVASALIHS